MATTQRKRKNTLSTAIPAKAGAMYRTSPRDPEPLSSMPVVLPHKYRFLHDYSVFLHDLIVGSLKAAMEARVFDVRLNLSPDQAQESAGLSGEALYDWIERQLGEDVSCEMDFKGVTRALIEDFCHYVLEGLNASKKGKLTVAFTLFRKPFQDNLFYLE